MAICHEMKEGDVFFCELCGLELRVEKTCSCGTGNGHLVPCPRLKAEKNSTAMGGPGKD